MGFDIVHNARARLAAPHVVGDDQLVCIDGTVFGSPSSNHPVRVVGEDVAGNIVIFHATTRTGNTLTGLTAIESTSDLALANGDKIEERDTAGRFSDIHARIEANDLALDQLYNGKAGGQTLTGGTAPGEHLTLQSTVNGTKGLIKLGANSAYDETQDRLGIGTLIPAYNIHLQGTNDSVGYAVQNLDPTGASSTQWINSVGMYLEMAFQGPNAPGNLAGISSHNLAYLTCLADNLLLRLNGSGLLALAVGSLVRMQIDATGLVSLPNGKFRLPRMVDANAPNDTVYISLDQSPIKPVYKDDTGTVHPFY